MVPTHTVASNALRRLSVSHSTWSASGVSSLDPPRRPRIASYSLARPWVRTVDGIDSNRSGTIFCIRSYTASEVAIVGSAKNNPLAFPAWIMRRARISAASVLPVPVLSSSMTSWGPFPKHTVIAVFCIGRNSVMPTNEFEPPFAARGGFRPASSTALPAS